MMVKSKIDHNIEALVTPSILFSRVKEQRDYTKASLQMFLVLELRGDLIFFCKCLDETRVTLGGSIVI